MLDKLLRLISVDPEAKEFLELAIIGVSGHIFENLITKYDDDFYNQLSLKHFNEIRNRWLESYLSYAPFNIDYDISKYKKRYLTLLCRQRWWSIYAVLGYAEAIIKKNSTSINMIHIIFSQLPTILAFLDENNLHEVERKQFYNIALRWQSPSSPNTPVIASPEDDKQEITLSIENQPQSPKRKLEYLDDKETKNSSTATISSQPKADYRFLTAPSTLPLFSPKLKDKKNKPHRSIEAKLTPSIPRRHSLPLQPVTPAAQKPRRFSDSIFYQPRRALSTANLQESTVLADNLYKRNLYPTSGEPMP